MNIIRLLLIGGLVYFAMQQKKEGNRNMILIVSGLLAVCMLSKEGFTVDLTPDTVCSGTRSPTPGTPETILSCLPTDGVSDCSVNCGNVACTAESAAAVCRGLSNCSYTAGAAATSPSPGGACDSTDLSEDGQCHNGCTTTVRDRHTRLGTYFLSDSMTSLDLTYNGNGADIAAPTDLVSQFKCGTGNTNPTLKNNAPSNAGLPIDLRQFLECPDDTPPPPPGSDDTPPPPPGPPSGSPPSTPPSSSTCSATTPDDGDCNFCWASLIGEDCDPGKTPCDTALGGWFKYACGQ